jgi:hypothetical protein
MEQLLQIHTTYGSMKINSEQGQFYRTGKYGDHQPKLNINKEDGGGVKMQKTPMKMELNTDEVLNSVQPDVATVVSRIPEEAKQAALEATAAFARMGRMYRDPDVNAVTQSSENVILEDGRKEWGLGWTPTVQAETTFTPDELNFSYERDKITVQLERGMNEFDFKRGETTSEVAQPGYVNIEYVGSYRKFPTGQNIDTRA